MSDSEVWFDTDCADDVLNSLAHTLLCLRRTTSDDSCWKWAILSYFSAVHGAMVCHLSGTAQLGALEKRSAKEWLTAYAAGGALPNPRLATPKELLKRLSDGALRIEPASSTISISDEQKASFKKLNDFRDEFVHFKPCSWSIELSGMKAILLDCLPILDAISAEGWAFRHIAHSKVSKLLDEIGIELRHP